MTSPSVVRGVSAFLLSFACLALAAYTAVPAWFGLAGAGASVIVANGIEPRWVRGDTAK